MAWVLQSPKINCVEFELFLGLLKTQKLRTLLRLCQPSSTGLVPDDRFGVLNNPTCTNVGFSWSSTSRKEGIWRKGTTIFSLCHLAVYISCYLANSCTEQPPQSMGGLVPCYRAWKKGGCIGRKHESIFKSGAWDLIWCNWQSTNFVFCRVIYQRERRADTWPGESKVYLFSFQCCTPHTTSIKILAVLHTPFNWFEFGEALVSYRVNKVLEECTSCVDWLCCLLLISICSTHWEQILLVLQILLEEMLQFSLASIFAGIFLSQLKQ